MIPLKGRKMTGAKHIELLEEGNSEGGNGALKQAPGPAPYSISCPFLSTSKRKKSKCNQSSDRRKSLFSFSRHRIKTEKRKGSRYRNPSIDRFAFA